MYGSSDELHNRRLIKRGLDEPSKIPTPLSSASERINLIETFQVPCMKPKGVTSLARETFGLHQRQIKNFPSTHF